MPVPHVVMKAAPEATGLDRAVDVPVDGAVVPLVEMPVRAHPERACLRQVDLQDRWPTGPPGAVGRSRIGRPEPCRVEAEGRIVGRPLERRGRSDEQTSELQSSIRIPY